MKLSDKQLRKILREVMEGCGCAGCEDQGDHDSLHSAVDSLMKDSDPMIAGHGGKARMARGHLYHIAKRAQSLHDRFDDEDELPEWVQSKLAVAESMVNSVYDHMDYKLHKHETGSLSEVHKLVRSALNEAGEDRKVSNAELVKGLKSGAAGIAKEIPQKYNDDFVDAMNTLVDMAQFDKAKFTKVAGLIDKYGAAAGEKAAKNEKPGDKKEDPAGGEEAPEGGGKDFDGF